jgi:hypothetical protein
MSQICVQCAIELEDGAPRPGTKLCHWCQERATERASLLSDVNYAIRQLRQHRSIDRALDALERVQGALQGEGQS